MIPNSSPTETATGEPSVDPSVVRSRHGTPGIWFWCGAAAILFVAALLRTFAIETRPFHSDESVNNLFVDYTTRDGYYKYSHENYHGPLFFYWLTGFVRVFDILHDYGLFFDRGDCPFGMRFVAIFFGFLTVALILGLRRLEGTRLTLLATLCAALSPSLVFFSRYAIHESLLVFGSLGLALSLFGWIHHHHRGLIYSAALSVAVLITTKETFAAALFCIGLGILACGGWRAHFQALCKQWQHVLTATLLALVVIVFVFTGAFRWADGLREMVLAIPQWIGRSSSDQGHVKPFPYYARDVIWITEPQLAIAMVLALVLWGAHAVTRFAGLDPLDLSAPHRLLLRVLTIWTGSSLLVYSFIPYKTVWLVINVTLPGAMLMGTVLSCLLAHPTLRYPGWALTIVALGASWFFTCRYNFGIQPIPGTEIAVADAQPYGPENPFSYVHTSPGFIEVTTRISKVWEVKPQAKVLIALEGYFPLPYYLRRFASNTVYSKVTDFTQASKEYDVMILDYYKQRFSSPDWEKNYYRLSDFAEANLYIRRSLLPSQQGTSAAAAPGTTGSGS